VAGFSFKRLGFDAFDLYAHYFRNATHEDLTFYGSFPLMMYARFGYEVVDGHLFVFRHVRGAAGERLDSVGLPIDEKGGRLDVATTRKCLDAFNRGPGGRIVSLHPALSARYPSAFQPRPASSIGSEYVYSNELLAGLKGGALKNLRKSVHRFASRYSFEIIPYEKKLRADADRVYERWRQREGAKYERVWDRTLFANLLDHHGSMDHHLFAVIEKTGGSCIGLFDAVRISPKLAIGVIRKLDTSHANIAQYCQVFLARHLDALGCPFLNDGDDAGGRPGLRELKSRFHPISTYTPLAYRF
jgi:hypothetical protein